MISASFQDVGNRVERRRVLAQRLACVEREQRDGSAGALEENTADHRSLLIAGQPQQRHECGGRHFRWSRHEVLSRSSSLIPHGPLGFAPDLCVGLREYNRPQPGPLSTGTMPMSYEAAFRHSG